MSQISAFNPLKFFDRDLDKFVLKQNQSQRLSMNTFVTMTLDFRGRKGSEFLSICTYMVAERKGDVPQSTVAQNLPEIIILFI